MKSFTSLYEPLNPGLSPPHELLVMCHFIPTSNVGAEAAVSFGLFIRFKPLGAFFYSPHCLHDWPISDSNAPSRAVWVSLIPDKLISLRELLPIRMLISAGPGHSPILAATRSISVPVCPAHLRRISSRPVDCCQAPPID